MYDGSGSAKVKSYGSAGEIVTISILLKVGKWQKPGDAGGCLNHKESFLRNPQYRWVF
jgi:hypothetical protein